MISKRLAQIYQEVSDELVSIFKDETHGYKHHTEAVTNNIRYSGMMETVDVLGRTIVWTRDLPPADELVPFPAPIDRAIELFERMKSARRANETAIYWKYWERPGRSVSELSDNDVEALRILTVINRKLDDIAAERGRDPTQFRSEVAAELKEVLDGRPVGIRIKPEVLEAVLRDGRFKSKFETGTSGGGTTVKGRAWQERIWFGYNPRTLPDDQRPIYGT